MKLKLKPAQLIDHVETGAQVRAERERQGLKLQPVADEMGITVQFLSDLERGRRNWTEELLEKAEAAIKKAAK